MIVHRGQLKRVKIPCQHGTAVPVLDEFCCSLSAKKLRLPAGHLYSSALLLIFCYKQQCPIQYVCTGQKFFENLPSVFPVLAFVYDFNILGDSLYLFKDSLSSFQIALSLPAVLHEKRCTSMTFCGQLLVTCDVFHRNMTTESWSSRGFGVSFVYQAFNSNLLLLGCK